MSAPVTLGDLARRAAVALEQVREWQARGLLGDAGGDGFSARDVERARLLGLFARRGIDLDGAIAWIESGRMDRYLELLSPATTGSTYSTAEAAAETGLDVAVVERFVDQVGLGGPDQTLSADDVEMLRLARTALAAGFPVDACAELARVYADALDRVAEAEARLFHFYVRGRLRAQGLAGRALDAALVDAGTMVNPLTGPLTEYFHRRAFERAIRDQAVMEAAEEAGLLREGAVPGQMSAAVVFLDLSRFTPLAEAMGDVRAAEVLARFGRLVREEVERADGRVVKQIGDGFMLLFPDPRAALWAALAVDARATAEPQFPAVRSGIHWGPVLFRDGDWVGANVNLAARVAAEAGPHEVVVTGAVRHAASGLADVEFVPLPRRRLKGVAEPLDLFAARSANAPATARIVDPVCGMELGPQDVAVRLSLAGHERAFCSPECLRRFVAAPERYGA
jgi:class 3 adenylate cyclase/YHS domain-containing protein